MATPDKIQNHIIQKLTKGLPAYLTYHKVSHTLDVMNQALIIASEEGVDSSDDLLLLQTSALYHDVGFIYVYEGHEEKSCLIAQEELKEFGFTDTQIRVVCNLIRSTKIPQSPSTLLEEIICDADLDYLGRSDFYTIGEGLYKEFMRLGIVANENEWNQLQVRFLERHHYFTKTCQNKRETFKQQHLEELRKKIIVKG